MVITGRQTRIMLNTFEQQVREADGQTVNTFEPLEDMQSTDILKALNRNADGDAHLFIELHRGFFLYDCAAGCWYKWSRHNWKEDLTSEVLQAVSNIVELYETEARRQAWLRAKAAKEQNFKGEVQHRENENALLKRMRALQSLNRKQEVLILAKSGRDTLSITGEEWDKDPWSLAVLNGVIDLKAGRLRPGNPTDFIKTAAPTEWRGINEPCYIWERFLSDIFRNNTELMAFIQRLLGYGITGLSTLHIFIILWGLGRNGKGTMLETLRRVLGDLAMKTEAELLLEQKYTRQAGSPNSGVLSLRGRRIVWASETSDGRRLNAGEDKRISWRRHIERKGCFRQEPYTV